MSIFSMFNFAIRNPNPNPDSEIAPMLWFLLFIVIIAWFSYMSGRRFVVNDYAVVCCKCKNKRLKSRKPGQLVVIKRDPRVDNMQCQDCRRR